MSLPLGLLLCIVNVVLGNVTLASGSYTTILLITIACGLGALPLLAMNVRRAALKDRLLLGGACAVCALTSLQATLRLFA